METGAFSTDTGVLVPAVTADEMRSIDTLATDSLGLSLLQMMENAGRNVAEHILEATTGPVLVIAGDGGNGGGGLACARHLHNHGRPVSILLYRDARDTTGAAATQYNILDQLDVPASSTPESELEPDASVIVDAIIGYGLSGPPRGSPRKLITSINKTDATVVSLDVPSGLDATTGTTPGQRVESDHVLTLALPKTGLHQLDCSLSLADISIPASVFQQLDIPYEQPFGAEYRVPITPT